MHDGAADLRDALREVQLEHTVEVDGTHIGVGEESLDRASVGEQREAADRAVAPPDPDVFRRDGVDDPLLAVGDPAAPRPPGGRHPVALENHIDAHEARRAGAREAPALKPSVSSCR